MADPKNLMIALEIRKKNAKKKMAKGGMVNESAKSEQRPMPDETDKDTSMVSRNSGNKAPKDDGVGSDVTVKQAQKPSITKLSQPKIVGSDAFSVRNRDQRDENNDQIEASAPASDKEQPQQRYNEVDADKSGPELSDMQKQHNNQKAPYNKAIEDQYAQDIADANMKKEQSYAQGGMVKPDNRQPQPEADDMEHASIAAAIMSKRAKFAEGGMVNDDMADIMENGKEHPNAYYGHNKDILKENYMSDMEDVSQPMDSNEMNDPREDEESDKHDMVSSIRRKMNVKRQFSGK